MASSQEKIRVCCPDCGKGFQVSTQSAGKKAKCTGCQAVIVIPATATVPPASNDLSDLLDETYPITPGPLPARAEAAPEAAAPVYDPRVEAMERTFARQRGEKKSKAASRPTEDIFRGLALMGAAGGSVLALGFVAHFFRFIPCAGFLGLSIIVGFFMGLAIFLRGIVQLLTGRR
jgi:hypothetical protein